MHNKMIGGSAYKGLPPFIGLGLKEQACLYLCICVVSLCCVCVLCIISIDIVLAYFLHRNGLRN